ncbi:class A beta-lactamase [Kineococcus rhizosphaerae]|uniref:Beta-lactamase n=1 Tax=Kineococcus rhizosphaerae TaxID=559628 RepID=A0A2T0R071_9ACTN|nr:class A beta-lactamase [Kineococcus rhizosphaerae]PRY12531.1 beta-lactamase class A [Kineococcus rhizosphaerae]
MRRPLSFAAFVLVLAGCTSTPADDTPAGSSGSPGVSAGASPSASPADAAVQARFAQLEESFDARLGVFAVDTGSGRTVVHRGDERFGFASTYKALAAGALLERTGDAELDAVVTWTADEVVAHSPVTGQHTASGLPLRQVAEAAVTVSDNTAANVVLAHLGGPAGLEEDLRALGDDTTEVEHTEPDVNDITPGDPADTSTPRAMATTLQAYATGDVLAPAGRDQLVRWLQAGTTGGGQIRAGVPAGWVVGDKTGHAGVYGNQNDIGVVWPTGGRAPWVLAILTDRADVDATSDEALLARATEVVVDELS